MALTEPRKSTSLLPAILYAGGLAAVLFGQRVLVTSETAKWALTGLGVASVIASAALRFVRALGAEGERRAIERALGLLTLVGVFALALMLATTEAGSALLGASKWESKARFDEVATVAWIIALLTSALPLAFAETALFPMRFANELEARRVLSSGAAGLTLALAASYGALFTYSAGTLDLKADFSYFRTARPGESSRKIAAALTEEVKVYTFFPQLNDVAHEVSGYLEDLSKGAPKLLVEHHDRVLSPGLARDNKITQDGIIVVRRGTMREMLYIGIDMAQSRNRLRTLDGDFQKILLKLVREPKIAYFTVGHGELNETSQSQDRRVAHGLRQILEAQSFAIRDLGLAEGLGTEVPSDASVVLVLGPAQPFLPAEVEALERYAKRGGHLLLALDPEANIDSNPLAKIAGLSTEPVLLANDRVHVRKRFNDSDRTVLATHQYSSHASVTTLGRAGMRAPIVLPGVSALTKIDGADAGLRIDFAVRSLGETFDDRNGNYRFDADEETRQTYNLAAAVSQTVGEGEASKEARIFVLGDVDGLSDWALGNEPNAIFIIDVMRWLGGEESFAGSIANTEDVRIDHTKQKDVAWFYSMILGVPSVVLGLGLFFNRRKKGKRGLSDKTDASNHDNERRAA